MASTSRRELLSIAPAAAWLGAGGAVLGQNAGAGQSAPAGHAADGTDPRGSLVQKMLAASAQGDQYVLPALPYPYDALEPHIDARTMELHHQRHHRGYVDGLNRAVRMMGAFRVGGEVDSTQLAGLQREISFNGGGHVLHTVFWATMGGGMSERPLGAIGEAIRGQFGSFETFREMFLKVAAGVKGSGWAALMYEPVGDRLFIFQINEHDTHLTPGAVPLLPLDVWEHAYYLRYGPARAEYVQAWWNVVNWSVVDESYRWMRSRRQEAAMTTAGR